MNALDTAKVGDGVTWTLWSDSKAGTIIARTEKTITVQLDHAELLNGMNSDAEDKLIAHVGGFAAHVSGTQRYAYSRNPEGRVLKFTKRNVMVNCTAGEAAETGQWRKPGTIWKLVGTGTKSPGNRLTAGRNEHYDYNF